MRKNAASPCSGNAKHYAFVMISDRPEMMMKDYGRLTMEADRSVDWTAINCRRFLLANPG
jgi:hypothetical protein